MAYHVLVIDDEEAVRNVLTAFLTKHGLTVRAEETVQSALNALLSEPFDMVMLDMCLPEGDGFEFIDPILEIRPGVPILILTGLDVDQDLVDVAIQAGAAGCLSKLTPFRDLIANINSVLTKEDATIQSRLLTGHREVPPA